MIHTLIKPLDYPVDLDSVVKCLNCGGNIVRVVQTWAILKDEFCRISNYPKVMISNVDFYCAACGKMIEGYQLIDENVIEEEFDCQRNAESYIRGKGEMK